MCRMWHTSALCDMITQIFSNFSSRPVYFAQYPLTISHNLSHACPTGWARMQIQGGPKFNRKVWWGPEVGDRPRTEKSRIVCCSLGTLRCQIFCLYERNVSNDVPVISCINTERILLPNSPMCRIFHGISGPYSHSQVKLISLHVFCVQ